MEIPEGASAMKTVVKIKNLTRRFGRKVALDDVSLEIPSGCVFALLGENGAGKTTAIRNILGLDRPNSGSIEVLGMDPGKHGVEIRRSIGYVSDSPALYDWMRVRQMAWFASGFYPPGFEAEFHRFAAEFDLPLKQKIKQLSKGGRAKVALALALAHRPDLLVMDEPTSGLDTLVRRKFLESMVDVAAEGRTVFLSSHQIPEVERVADHVAIVNQGRILVCERLETLKSSHERWVITVKEGGRLPSFEGQVLTHEGHGKRRQQVMVLNPGPNALWELRDSEGVLDVEVHTPSLEEIFIAYLQSSPVKPVKPVKIDPNSPKEASL